MRILTVCKDLQRGGTQRVAQTFSLEYAARGHEVAVLAWHQGGVRQKTLEDAGVPVFTTDQGDLATALAAADVFDPEVVHLHHPGVPRGDAEQVLRALRKADRRVVASSHFGRVGPPGYDALIDAHIQLSNWCLWRWRCWLAGRPAVGVALPNPVDIDRFHRAGDDAITAYRRDELGLPDDAFLCGRIGQSNRGKWHPALLAAFARLAAERRDLHLAMIGTPDFARPAIDALPAGVRARVHCLDPIDNEAELCTLYSSMDLFLHAAQIGETFGLVLAEAMLCGTPPVTLATPHRDNSQGEVVVHGRGGLVALSAKDFRPAVEHALAHPDELAAMRANGRALIADRYNSPAVAGRALRLMEHTLADPSPAGLERRISSDEELVSEVNDAEIRRVLRDGIGKPSWKDLLLMRLSTSPTVRRLYAKLPR